MGNQQANTEARYNLTQSNDIRKVTIKLATPAIMEMLLQTLLGFVDLAMVGGLGAAAITAVGLGDMPIYTMMAVFTALGTGTTAVVARYIGASEFDKARDAARQSLMIAIAGGVLIASLILIFSRPIAVFLGAEKEVLPLTMKFMTISASAMVFLVIGTVMGGALRGCGDNKTPMYANGISNIVNIIANFLLINKSATYTFNLPLLHNKLSLFIPGAGMGVAGSATATAIARTFAACVIMFVLFSGKAPVKFSIRDKYRINTDIIKKIFNIGIPAAAEQLSMRFGQTFYGRKVAMLGTVLYASHRIALTAESLSYLPGFGFAIAATTLVGQYLGAKKPEMSQKSCFEAVKLSMILMSAFGLLFFIWPQYFIAMFTKDPEIAKNAVICLRIVAISQPVLACVMVFSGGLRGAGDTKWVLYSTLIGIWGVRLLGTYILIDFFRLGLVGAWIAMGIDLYVRGFLNFLRFKNGGWKNVKI